MNARRLTVEGQLFLDDIDALPAEAQRQVTNVVASLKKRHLEPGQCQQNNSIRKPQTLPWFDK